MTFTFTIDCMPGYTKFNKVNKVLACTQLLSGTEDSHNYANKAIHGHEDRTSDADVDTWYSKSVFADEATDGGDADPILP